MIEKMLRVRRLLATGFAMLVLPAILGLASASRAEEPASVFLEDLTWTELRDAVAGGRTTIIIPIGGTEQNGPAMALGKHNVRVKQLSQKIALALGNAIVAPVIAYVPEGAITPPQAICDFPARSRSRSRRSNLFSKASGRASNPQVSRTSFFSAIMAATK